MSSFQHQRTHSAPSIHSSYLSPHYHRVSASSEANPSSLPFDNTPACSTGSETSSFSSCALPSGSTWSPALCTSPNTSPGTSPPHDPSILQELLCATLPLRQGSFPASSRKTKLSVIAARRWTGAESGDAGRAWGAEPGKIRKPKAVRAWEVALGATRPDEGLALAADAGDGGV